MLKHVIPFVVLDPLAQNLADSDYSRDSYLQHFYDLLQANVFSQSLHVDFSAKSLSFVFPQVFGGYSPIDTLTTHLSKPSPEFYERIFVQHLVERLPRVKGSLPLPFVKLPFQFPGVKPKLGGRW